MTVLGLPIAFIAAAIVAVIAGGGDEDAIDSTTQSFAIYGFGTLVLTETGIVSGTVGFFAAVGHLLGGVL